jgi:hypothetical protein
MAQLKEEHAAVFVPDGRLVHAEGALRDDRRCRDLLSTAVRAIEMARASAERTAGPHRGRWPTRSAACSRSWG